MSYQPVSANIDGGRTPEMQHLQLQEDPPFSPLSPRFIGADTSDVRASLVSSQPTLQTDDYNSSSHAFNQGLKTAQTPRDSYAGSPAFNEKSTYDAKPRSRKKAIIIGAIVSLLIIVGVVLAVYFAVIRPNQNKDNNGTTGNISDGDGSSDNKGDETNNSGDSKDGDQAQELVVTGGDGSKITLEDGSTFTYTNKFGGTWYYDPEKPFVSGARAQSWTPAINETFKFGKDLIRGVNLGGWLVMEPFIAPALFERYSNTSDPAVDEYTLSERLAAETGNLNEIEEHYKTFITEKDFAEIAAAGLNFVRIPVPYWAIEVRENEPFLPKVAWTYFLKAIQWGRKYGIRIKLDLHTLPGSQNGWNHSSKLGSVNVLNGPMGLANAQRSLDYIRIFAEFISQPEYSDVVVMFGIVNEPQGSVIGKDALKRFYVEAYKVVRTASGIGEGKGPWIVIGEGFFGLQEWADFMPHGDRLQLDVHHYLSFTQQSADDYADRVRAGQPCNAWARGQNQSMSAFGMTHVGEWSLAINDCGQYLNGVNLGQRFDGTFAAGGSSVTGDCGPYIDYTQYTDQWRKEMKQFALQSMSALQNWFFWTWKIGNSTVYGRPGSPAWSYQLGLKEGWMPEDPRLSEGVCKGSNPFVGPFPAWHTGGAGAGDIPQTFLDEFSWPPTTLRNADNIAALPQYTPTGTIVTLPGPSITASVSQPSGWNNPSDTARMYVPVATCGYLDPWMGPDRGVSACPPLRARRHYAPRAVITPAPSRQTRRCGCGVTL